MTTRFVDLLPENMPIKADAPRNVRYDPTRRQLIFLTAIKDLTPWKGESPTFREVAAAMKVSVRTCAMHCEYLRRKGLLNNEAKLINTPRNLILTDRGEVAVAQWLENPASIGTRIGQAGAYEQRFTRKPSPARGAVIGKPRHSDR